MILVDFNHLNSSILHSSIATLRPKKKNGKYITEDFKDFMINGILTSFGYFIKTFKEYGEIICCLEGRSWRKDFYEYYKANRQQKKDVSEINYQEVYGIYEELAITLKESFGIKTLRADGAEGDDIIAVLSEYSFENNLKSVIISSDKDFKQLFKYNVDIYDPIKKEFRVRPKTSEEIQEELELHIIKGDDVDNIPNIISETEFSPNFLSYLKNNNIFIDNPEEFFKLSVSKDLVEKYDIFQVYKTGKNKGQKKEEKDIFKSLVLTKKKIQELQSLIKEDNIFAKNYQRNKTLIDFDYIPSEIKENIKKTFKETKVQKANPIEIMKFCTEHKLKQLMGNYSIFLLNKQEDIGDW